MLSENARAAGQGRVKVVGLQLVLALLFVGAAAVAASGQSQINYSDEWGDDSADQDIKVVGAGLTEASYYSFGFAYYVVTEVRSPTGQVFTATSSAGSTYSRIETWVWWNWVWGWWYVYSSHWVWNYYQNYRYVSNYTNFGNDWFNSGSDKLEYYNDDPNPVSAGGFDGGRYCSYQICPENTNNECASGRRAILRDDGRSGTEQCKAGYIRWFNIVGVGPAKFCRESDRMAITYDPCPYTH